MASTTLYGAFRTTTFSTTITALPEWGTPTISFPDITGPIQYTTLASPADSASKYYTTPLPILVLTEIDGVIVNAAGSTYTTFTEAQAVPTNALVVPSAAEACNTWVCWDTSMRVGVATGGAIAVFALLLLAICAGFCSVYPPKERNSDEEQGNRRHRTCFGRKNSMGRRPANPGIEEEAIELEDIAGPPTEEEIIQATGTSEESSGRPSPPSIEQRSRSSEIMAFRAYNSKRVEGNIEGSSADCAIASSESSVRHSGEVEERERGRGRFRDLHTAQSRGGHRREDQSAQNRCIRRPERVHLREVGPGEGSATREVERENPFDDRSGYSESPSPRGLS